MWEEAELGRTVAFGRGGTQKSHLTRMASFISQLAFGIWSLPSQAVITGELQHLLGVYSVSGDPDASPLASVASAVTT